MIIIIITSTALFSPEARELMEPISLTALLASLSSASVCLFPRSAESSRDLASSISPARPFARRSARLAFSASSCLTRDSSVKAHSASRCWSWSQG